MARGLRAVLGPDPVGSVIEPLLGVNIPDDIVFVGKHHRAGEYGEKVILLQEVYDNEKAQERLIEICRLFANQANVRMLMVEGADSEVKPSPPGTSLRQLMMVTPVSAGVMFLLQQDEGLFEAWGVDDMELNVGSQGAMSHLMSGQRRREEAFDRIRELIRAAQGARYQKGIADMRTEVLRMFQEKLTLATRVGAIAREAKGVGLDLHTFPAVQGFLDFQELDRQVDTKRVATQREEFVTRLVTRLWGWFTFVEPNQLEVDMAAAAPIIDYWREATGRSREEFDGDVAARGWEPVLGELKQWIDTWLVTEAQRMGGGGSYGQTAARYEEFMRLALRLGVDYFDLIDFRRQVAGTRDFEKFRDTLAEEMPAAARAVIDRLDDLEAIQLRVAEDQLDTIYRALCLEVPPLEAEMALVDPARLRSICEEVAALAGTEIQPALREALSTLDSDVEDAALFLDHSLRRGQHMARKTIELMREQGEDRALLVAGGFHERTITRELENEREVSWSVLAPKPEL
jgi:hypothetical protein